MADTLAQREARRRDAELPEFTDDDFAPSLFLALSTQWERAASGHRIGLNYGVIPAVAGMMEIPMSPGLLHDLRIMEAEALSVLASKA